MSQDQEPHTDLNARHNHAMRQETIDSMNSSPEPLYRLRISVLKDGEGTRDCPVRMFTFNSHRALRSAVDQTSDTFGGAFSEYTITQGGVLGSGRGGGGGGVEAGEEGVEDGRTEDMLISVDSQTADESWHEFLGRMDKVKKDWAVEELGVKTVRGGGVAV